METKKFNLQYTNINHTVRREFDISVLEYVICDWVYHLSTNPESNFSGWCYSSKENLAVDFGITKQGLFKLIDKLILKGLLEKHHETRYLKTSKLWNIKMFTDGKQSLLKEVNKVYSDGKQSLLNINNNINNNKTLFENENLDKSTKVLFENCIYNKIENVRNYLLKEKKYVEKYKGVDLEFYIESVKLWSNSSNTKRTNNGWISTILNFMNKDIISNKLQLKTKNKINNNTEGDLKKIHESGKFHNY